MCFFVVLISYYYFRHLRSVQMGQTLSEPVTAKETARCANDDVMVGSSCMQGWRVNMEDAHTHILSLKDDEKSSFFGVYDGHGGYKVAHYASENLHKKILTQPNYGELGSNQVVLKLFE